MNKICTSIEQSKKLIELGIDVNTADMYYQWYSETESALHVGKGSKKLNADCPAWSLSALLDVLPEINGIPLTLEKVKAEDGYEGYYYHIEYEGKILIPYSKNPVDACYEMILKLNELNLL